MRERDKPMLQSAKIVIALGAAALTILIWAINAHVESVCLAVLSACKDTILFCIGARATAMVTDAVEAVMTKKIDKQHPTGPEV